MKKIIAAALVCFLLASCGIGDTNTTYSRSDIGSQGRVEYGRIVSMDLIKTQGTSAVGTLAGAGAGGAAGSMLGGNTAVNIIGGVGGAVVGGIIGSSAEKAITRDTAYEFIIEKTNGTAISVVQSNELNLRVGDRVLLSTVNGTTRIRSRAN
ncbi:MAG: hypothetical protein LBU87_02535 [Lactobacillales bacterium]|nr:hypothetical protein [Lactobacillales bacterium]